MSPQGLSLPFTCSPVRPWRDLALRRAPLFACSTALPDPIGPGSDARVSLAPLLPSFIVPEPFGIIVKRHSGPLTEGGVPCLHENGILPNRGNCAMRIRGGKNRGRELRALKSDHIRPPLERVRQVIFSILAERITGANILDIFAGTGSLGLEALSRGAKRALFVDNSAQSVHVLRNNIASCRMEARTQVMMMSAFQIFNSRRLREAGPYEIIFADTPYPLLDMPRGLGRFLRLLDKLVEENLLAPDGRVIARCRPGVMKLAELNQMDSQRSESIGDTEVFFLKQKTTTKGV